MPVRDNTNRVPYFKDCPKPLTFSPRNIIIIKRTKFACLAQPVEHAAVNRSVGGSSPRRQKTPHLEVFFLALFGDMTPARFARFRRSRNDTADTALDAIGTPCNDRYSVAPCAPYGGSSPLAGAIVAARRTSQHLAQQRGVFACMPAAPLRVAKTQDVRCAPRSCGTIAPLSHFCSAGRLRRGFFFYFLFIPRTP